METSITCIALKTFVRTKIVYRYLSQVQCYAERSKHPTLMIFKSWGGNAAPPQSFCTYNTSGTDGVMNMISGGVGIDCFGVVYWRERW